MDSWSCGRGGDDDEVEVLVRIFGEISRGVDLMLYDVASHGGYSLLLSLRLLPKGLRPFGIPGHTRLGL